MQKAGKLELTWVGKYDDKVVEPRILIEDSTKSYGDQSSPCKLCNMIFMRRLNVSTSIRRTILAVHLNTMMIISNIVSGLVL